MDQRNYQRLTYMASLVFPVSGQNFCCISLGLPNLESPMKYIKPGNLFDNLEHQRMHFKCTLAVARRDYPLNRQMQ